jgi:hypothetical protein
MSPDSQAYLAGVREGKKQEQLSSLRALAAVVYAANNEHTVTVGPAVFESILHFSLDCEYLPGGGVRYKVTV